MTASYYGLVALRHHFQVKFSEMHSVLSGQDEEGVYGGAKIDENNFRKSDDTTTPLETSGDAISWKILKQAKLKSVSNDTNHALLPKYTPDIEELDNQNITVQGFMFPLDSNNKQSHFLISPYPVSCPYCYPAGATELIEVFSKKPIKFSYDPITLKGDFNLLKTSKEIQGGMLYQLNNARVMKN